MQFHFVILIVLVLCDRFFVTKLQQYDIPTSPCPRLFQYKFDGNSWNGELELPSPPIQHREVILQITLSLRAATTVRSYMGIRINIFNVNVNINEDVIIRIK